MNVGVEVEGSFRQRAEWAAERNVREWIRKTLREVFLQALQRYLYLLSSATTTTTTTMAATIAAKDNNNRNSSSHNHQTTVRLSSIEDLEKCMRLVERVSEEWQDELRQHNHLRTADWVQDVWDSGRDDLWSRRLEVLLSVDRSNHPERRRRLLSLSTSSSSSSSPSTLATQPNRGNATSATTTAASRPQGMETDPVVEEEDSTVPQVAGNGDECCGGGELLLQVPYCQLRKLGRPTTCEINNEDEQGKAKKKRGRASNVVLSQLRAMGEQGQSYYYWPLGHQMVEDAARTIPNRQRGEQRRRRRPTPSKSMKYPVVLPKTLQETASRDEKDDSENDDDDETAATTTAQQQEEDAKILAAVLERAKSKLRIVPKDGGSKSTSNTTNKRKRGRPKTTRTAFATSETREEDNPPRPPSTISSSTHDVHEELTARDKAELDRLIYPDDDGDDDDRGDGTGPPTVCLFGALQDVGKIHASIQEENQKEGRSGASTASSSHLLTEKQRRRQERAYIKERLAPHRIEKNQDPQTYRSKVLRTEQECVEEEDGGSIITKHFLEFDLGWSLLEYEDDGGEKRLMAFSSIQASLEEKPASFASRHRSSS